MKPLKTKELKPLAKFIQKSYDSDLHSINRYLSKALYMLHHLPEDEFEEKDRQSVCYLLNSMREQFYKIASQKQHS